MLKPIQNTISSASKFALIALLIFTAVPVTPADAAVPKLITYQGILKDSGGALLTGTYSMQFKLYDAVTSGNLEWTETQSSVTVTSGRFSVQLGSVTALNLAFDEDYWLSIKVGSDAEMTPRSRITTVGYAVTADNVVNGFTESQHNAISHESISAVKQNSVLITKTNFKLDSYSNAVANNMTDLYIDVFTDASGINSGASSGYEWRGSPNYDVLAGGAGVDSYAKLMLHGNGTDASTTFTDSASGNKTVTANGNAQLDTAQSKFSSSASMLFDGTGDYLTVPDSDDWDFGTGDFTIDFWIRWNGSAGNTRIMEAGSWNGSSGWSLGLDSSTLTYYHAGNGKLSNSWSPSANTWYHIAITRSGTNLRYFIDGTQLGNTATNSDNVTCSTYGMHIGTWTTLNVMMNGWIEELRVTKGLARWTANFTPPASEYSSSGGTATVISNAVTQASAPTSVILSASDVPGSGSITYSVSRDNGTTWTTCTKDAVTSISSQPSGTQLKWKAVITGDAEVDAIGVAV